MATTTHPLLADLHQIADPLQRATRLTELADAREFAATPDRARLLRLIAATETLAARPDTEPEDDSAWDDDAWQQLAGATNRLVRAELLEEIWRDWAPADFGDDADILLEIAATERDAAHLQDDDLDADPFVRDEHADEAEPRGQEAPPGADRPPQTRLRDAAHYGKHITGGLVAAALVALVITPGVSWEFKASAAALLFVSILVWLLMQIWGARR